MDLYHGTSLRIWRQIQSDGFLKPAPHGDQHVSFSTCPMVAARFAYSAYEIGEFDGEEDGVGFAVLRAWMPTLESKGFQLHPFTSSVWGEGECDWEKEIACLDPVPTSLLSQNVFGPIAQHRKRHPSPDRRDAK